MPGVRPATAGPSATASPDPRVAVGYGVGVAVGRPEPVHLGGVLTWAPLEPAGAAPAAREDHTWTLDPAGRAGWLFGGRDGGTAP